MALNIILILILMFLLLFLCYYHYYFNGIGTQSIIQNPLDQ